MRKIFIYILISTAMFSLSCERERHYLDLSEYSGIENGWLNFQTGVRSVVENEERLAIVVSRTKFDVQDVVSFTVTSEYAGDGADANASFEIEPANLELNFAANQVTDTIFIYPIDNDFADGNKFITLALESSSIGAHLGYPGEAAVDSETVVTIIDDDCPFDRGNFVGIYDCDEPGYTVYEVEIEAGDDENTIIIRNFWDYASASIYVEFDSESNVITIPAQPTGLASGGIPVYAVGSGTYTACDGNFMYDYTIYRLSDGAVFENNTHTYTKK